MHGELEFSPFYPCLEGVLEHVAVKQCAFCRHADMVNEMCIFDHPGAKSKSPHECPHFKRDKKAPPYVLVRVAPPCVICGLDCYTDHIPRVNNVAINGDRFNPVCDDCVNTLKYTIKDKRRGVTKSNVVCIGGSDDTCDRGK